ncbi:MAG: PKD domain-containing protein, partial [Phycisphaerae bacterium]|nr:PKD domain-containing protein [Phycisphaerae bacterium]
GVAQPSNHRAGPGVTATAMLYAILIMPPYSQTTAPPSRYHRRRACGSVISLTILPLWCCGCPAMGTLPTAAPVMELTDEPTERPYLLYVPSIYSDRVSWPIVVACHGTWPYDTSRLQMREWAQFAENRGIIVLAPELLSTKGDFPPPPESQIDLQRQDEQAVLSIVSAIKRKYNVAEDRVFMTGWSAGAYPILYAGLRNPDVFRALAVRQGSFDERFMDIPTDCLGQRQRILVIYGMADFLRDQSKAMIEWLRARGFYVDEKEIAGSHRRIDPKLPWRFFSKVVKEGPWIRIRAHVVDPGQPLAIRFYLDAVPKAERQKWFFGDGDESYEPSPVHTYDQPGRYEVTVNVALKDGGKYSRRQLVRVGDFQGR